MGYLEDKEKHMSVANRVRKERDDLAGKIEKLETFIGGPDFASVDEAQRHLLVAQRAAMNHYKQILDERLDHFDGNGKPVHLEPEIGEPVEVGGHDIDRDGPPNFNL